MCVVTARLKSCPPEELGAGGEDAGLPNTNRRDPTNRGKARRYKCEERRSAVREAFELGFAPRRGAVLGCITNRLLHSHRAIVRVAMRDVRLL